MNALFDVLHVMCIKNEKVFTKTPKNEEIK